MVVGYLGRADANKSADILYRAIIGTDWWVILAGKNAPHPPPELEASIKDRIRVWPHEVENIGDWYRALDVFVLPSKSEGFPLCIAEAFLSGCRVVSTRVSDLEEVFGNAISFFEHGNVTDLRRAILQAPNAEEGKRVIAANLSVEKMLDQYEEILSLGPPTQTPHSG